MRRLWQTLTNNRLANILLWGGMFLVLLRILTFDVMVLFAAGGICFDEDAIRNRIESDLRRTMSPLSLNEYVKHHQRDDQPIKAVLLHQGQSNVALVNIFGEAVPLSYMGVPPCLPNQQRIIGLFKPRDLSRAKTYPAYFDPETFLRRDAVAGLPWAYRPTDDRLDRDMAFVVPQNHDLLSLIPLPDDRSVTHLGNPLLLHRAYDLSDQDVKLVDRLAEDINWWRQLIDLRVSQPTID